MHKHPTGQAALGAGCNIIISNTPAICVGVKEYVGRLPVYSLRYCLDGLPCEQDWSADAVEFRIENVVELRKAAA